MLKKIILKLNEKQTGYCFIPSWSDSCKKLEFVALGLSEYRNDFNVEVDEIPHKNIVFMYSSDFCKKRARIQFQTEHERQVYEKNYEKYYDKCWEEMPSVKLSDVDYGELKQIFGNLKQKKPLYIVFSLDNLNGLDKVSLIGKNELSKEDLQNMQRDHEEYLRWQKALQLYNSDHEIVDDLWRSPADSVYAVDIAKYLDRPEGFVKHKTYTKATIITELQEKLKKGEPVYLIVHWLRVRKVHGVMNSDITFENLLRDFANMDDGYPDMISREKLQEIADRLSLGQDVILD